jgi:tetratricopeptide (TPR) repeat protein
VKLLFIILLSICAPAFSQNEDSLRAVLIRLSKKPGVFGPDTSRCKTLSVLAEIAPEGEWQKFNEQLLKLSESNLKIVGESHQLTNFYKKYLAEAYNGKGFTLQQNSVNDPAILVFYNKSLDIRLSLNDKEGIAEIYNNLGGLYKDQGNVTKGLEYFYKSYSINETLGDKFGMASNLTNLAQIEEKTRDTVRALVHQQKALTLFCEIDFTDGIARAENNIGTLNLHSGNTDQALKSFRNSYSLNEEMGNKNGMALALNNIGAVYSQTNKFDAAEEYYRKALAIYEETKSKLGLAQTSGNLSKLFGKKKKYPQALDFGKRSLNLSMSIGMPEEIMNSAGALKTIYSRMGDYEKAFDMQELYYAMNDSVTRNKTRKENIRRQMMYEFGQREKELELRKEEEAKIQKALFDQKQRYMIIGFVLAIIIIITVFFFIYTRYKSNKRREEHELTFRLKDSEIKALRAQMNPHFIFNSLGGVLELIRKAEGEEAIKYLTKFSRLLRMILESSDKRSIPLAKEIELLTLYIDLENFRFGKSFKYNIKISPDLDTNDVEIPSLAIQPFVENAILHGIQNKKNISRDKGETYEGLISLSMQQEGDFLVCTVEDNGAGRKVSGEIKKKQVFDHRSMGVEITKDRLDLLGLLDSRIEYTDLFNEDGTPRGTLVNITIPLIKEF